MLKSVLPNCSVLASIFQNFPVGGMPPDDAPSYNIQILTKGIG